MDIDEIKSEMNDASDEELKDIIGHANELLDARECDEGELDG